MASTYILHSCSVPKCPENWKRYFELLNVCLFIYVVFFASVPVQTHAQSHFELGAQLFVDATTKVKGRPGRFPVVKWKPGIVEVYLIFDRNSPTRTRLSIDRLATTSTHVMNRIQEYSAIKFEPKQDLNPENAPKIVLFLGSERELLQYAKQVELGTNASGFLHELKRKKETGAPMCGHVLAWNERYEITLASILLPIGQDLERCVAKELLQVMGFRSVHSSPVKSVLSTKGSTLKLSNFDMLFLAALYLDEIKTGDVPTKDQVEEIFRRIVGD